MRTGPFACALLGAILFAWRIKTRRPFSFAARWSLKSLNPACICAKPERISRRSSARFTFLPCPDDLPDATDGV